MRWILNLLAITMLVVAVRAQDRASESSDRGGADVSAAVVDAATPDAQIGRFVDRYLWVVPESAGHKASLGIGVFVALAFIIMFSARLANLDGVTFGRGSFCSACVLVVSSLEVAFVPGSAPIVAAVCVLNLAAWFGLVRGALGGDFYNGSVMLVSTLFAVMLSLLGVQLAGTLLQRSALLG
ncbi:MAG: hypothetical protein KDB80_09925 [Planctomycetes bacterium]|nr:hypothetical protein [Planctomycetota bacterium]